MPTYFIRDWNEHFETAESRKYKTLSWVALPNKHDGKSFRRLMRMENGITLYGVWVLIVQVASKCPQRGILADADGPLTAEDISDKTGVPESLVLNALEVLTSERIGWMGSFSPDVHAPATPVVDQSATGNPPGESSGTRLIHNITEQNITQQNIRPAGRGNARWRRPGKNTLLDTAALMEWADLEAEKAGIPALTPDARIWLLAAALRATEHGSNPPRLFASLLIDLVSGNVELLEEYRKRAESRYQKWMPSE